VGWGNRGKCGKKGGGGGGGGEWFKESFRKLLSQE